VFGRDAHLLGERNLYCLHDLQPVRSARRCHSRGLRHRDW
jgi:hypothetical protein